MTTAICTTVLHKAENERGKWVNTYLKVKNVGQGSYGKVSLYRNAENDRLVAIKVMNKRLLSKVKLKTICKKKIQPKTALDAVYTEIQILMYLRPHPHVIKLIEVIDDPSCEKLYVVMECALGGPCIQSYGDMLSDEECLKVLEQAARGLMFLHENGIVHGDLKVEHLLRGEGDRLKIVDFGSSETFTLEDDRMVKSPGTPAYTAPECCLGTAYSGRKADVWALGITLYVIRYGKFPFLSCAAEAMYDEIQNKPIVYPASSDAHAVAAAVVDDDDDDDNLTFILKQMLTRDPSVRPSASQVVDMCQSSPCSANTHNKSRVVAGTSPDIRTRSVDQIEREFACSILP